MLILLSLFWTEYDTLIIQEQQQHPFYGPLFGTTRVSRYQKRKNNLDFTEAIDCGWQWHQLGYVQVCTLP